MLPRKGGAAHFKFMGWAADHKGETETVKTMEKGGHMARTAATFTERKKKGRFRQERKTRGASFLGTGGSRS